MSHTGTSVTEFFARFPDEQACLRQVFDVKWGKSGFCPSCDNRKGKWAPIKGTKRYEHSCRTLHSPLKDTVFYRSNLSLMAWFYALLLFTNCKTGMRSSFIRKQLGIDTKSAHRLCNQIRLHLASQRRLHRLGGVDQLVHIDEAFFRFIVDPKRSRHSNAIVLGFSDGRNVLSGMIPDRKRSTIMPILDRIVEPGSTLVTDKAAQYASLARNGWEHIAINHSVSFHNFEGVTNNPIEAYWRVLRRNLKLYRQTADHNFWRFLAETEYRYNRRFSQTSLFDEAVENFPEVSPHTMSDIRARFDWR